MANPNDTPAADAQMITTEKELSPSYLEGRLKPYQDEYNQFQSNPELDKEIRSDLLELGSEIQAINHQIESVKTEEALINEHFPGWRVIPERAVNTDEYSETNRNAHTDHSGYNIGGELGVSKKEGPNASINGGYHNSNTDTSEVTTNMRLVKHNNYVLRVPEDATLSQIKQFEHARDNFDEKMRKLDKRIGGLEDQPFMVKQDSYDMFLEQYAEQVRKGNIEAGDYLEVNGNDYRVCPNNPKVIEDDGVWGTGFWREHHEGFFPENMKSENLSIEVAEFEQDQFSNENDGKEFNNELQGQAEPQLASLDSNAVDTDTKESISRVQGKDQEVLDALKEAGLLDDHFDPTSGSRELV